MYVYKKQNNWRGVLFNPQILAEQARKSGENLFITKVRYS